MWLFASAGKQNKVAAASLNRLLKTPGVQWLPWNLDLTRFIFNRCEELDHRRLKLGLEMLQGQLIWTKSWEDGVLVNPTGRSDIGQSVTWGEVRHWNCGQWTQAQTTGAGSAGYEACFCWSDFSLQTRSSPLQLGLHLSITHRQTQHWVLVVWLKKKGERFNPH